MVSQARVNSSAPSLQGDSLSVLPKLDLYKATMSQFAFLHNPKTQVEFSFTKRGDTTSWLKSIDPKALQSRLDQIRAHGLGDMQALRDIRTPTGKALFKPEYITFIAESELPEARVAVDEKGLHIDSKGDWPVVSLWETVVLSEVAKMHADHEIYELSALKNQSPNVTKAELLQQGHDRLAHKLKKIVQYNQQNPNHSISFMDFGTRRRLSEQWHEQVLSSISQFKGNTGYLGTSNIGLALHNGQQPLGTYAHEMPMVFAALADAKHESIKQSHSDFMSQWQAQYPEQLVALTDTFTDDFFYQDVQKNPDFCDWQGIRQDSGDPFMACDRAIAFYQQQGIDPTTKTIVFSDGLDVDKMIELQDYSAGRIKTLFGIGTNLTNDVGIKPLSIVMKAKEVDGVSTVKLSNDKGKHTGSSEKIALYQQIFSSEVMS